MIIKPDFSVDILNSSTIASRIPMPTLFCNVERKSVFGRAFLIELQKGDIELARVFAKAFLLAGEKDNNAISNSP